MAKKQTIAIDLDDVLARSAEGFSKFSDERWGGNHNPEDMQENWKEFWKVPLDTAISRAKEFHESDAVRFYQPMDDALGVLKELKKQYKLIVITSRRIVLKDQTDEWLERFYPGVFENIHYAGIWDGDEHVYHKLKFTKSDICVKIGCDYLIDDQPKHCIGAAEAGIEALLFGNYKWNQPDSLPRGITRAANWAEVGEYFNAKS